MAEERFDPLKEIFKIVREDILNWRKVPLYDYVATYDNREYEHNIQTNRDIIAAIAELRKYKDGTGLASRLPPVAKAVFEKIAIQGEIRFERNPKPAPLRWRLPILLGYLSAITVPIAVGRIINDEIYFISKISTAVVTVYMLIPYMRGGYLSTDMLWKFAETRLIHPLAPLVFVVFAFIPAVARFNEESIAYKVLSGICGLVFLTALIFMADLLRNRLLGKIKRDVTNVQNRNEDFNLMLLNSKTVFTRARQAMLRYEMKPDKISISQTKQDQASFRKDTLASMIEGLNHFDVAQPKFQIAVFMKNFLASVKKIFNTRDPHWQTYHHPLPKSPVMFMEIGFMAGQLIIYRGYLATFIDTVVTQARVLIKLAKLVFKEDEPATAALAEFSRLVAGAIVGFFLLGIPYSVLGRAWVQGNNVVYLTIALTFAKLLLSNYVAPVMNLLGLLVFIAMRGLVVWVTRRIC